MKGICIGHFRFRTFSSSIGCFSGIRRLFLLDYPRDQWMRDIEGFDRTCMASGFWSLVRVGSLGRVSGFWLGFSDWVGFLVSGIGFRLVSNISTLAG